jgi:hypothetical protein
MGLQRCRAPHTPCHTPRPITMKTARISSLEADLRAGQRHLQVMVDREQATAAAHAAAMASLTDQAQSMVSLEACGLPWLQVVRLDPTPTPVSPPNVAPASADTIPDGVY